ncbi:MAG: hypothetical protein JW801_02955, partial [Bacteroidales bacterium]|nr:hypothetical protein [Bacteroidales bacterium]
MITASSLFASYETEGLLKRLDKELAKRGHYIQLKENRIENIRGRLTEEAYRNNPEVLYSLYDQLYTEYKSFNYDSAFVCVNQLNRLALQLNDPDRLTQSRIAMGFTLLSSGLFKEALDTLHTLDPAKCSLAHKQELYSLMARAYFDLADYSGDRYFAVLYNRRGSLYIDTAISYLSDDTPDYWSAVGLKKMKSNDYKGAVDAFNFLLTKFNISSHQYAIATSSVGYIYTVLNRENEAVDVMIKAALADIESSTKETVALRNLAALLFKKGDIDRAYRYITLALDDATYYNARHRKIEVGSVLPIIEGERLRIVENQRQKLSRYAVVVTILSIIVLFFSLVILIQLRRLMKIRKIQQKTNKDLQEMNTRLSEANIIKEEYI